MATTLLEKITALLAPIIAQIQDIKHSLDQVAKTADSAMELGLKNQEAAQQQQVQQDWATEKIMFLENQMKLKNSKLRSFPEGCKENEELRIFTSN